MPLTTIRPLSDDLQLGLWHITENVSELPCPAFLDLSGIHSEMRKKEQLVSYQLLQAMTGRVDMEIKHDAAGRPLIEDYQISLSHTRGWAAMILSKHHRVGVDVEYMSDRVNKVVDRFIRSDEERDGLEKRLVNWCAKEALYKLRSTEDLQYFDMRLHHFSLSDDCVVADDMRRGDTVSIHFECTSNYVLTWCAEP